MSNGNAPTLQSVYSCEENCRRTYTDWIAVSPETTETGVADLFYTVLFNGKLYAMIASDKKLETAKIFEQINLLDHSGRGYIQGFPGFAERTQVCCFYKRIQLVIIHGRPPV